MTGHQAVPLRVYIQRISTAIKCRLNCITCDYVTDCLAVPLFWPHGRLFFGASKLVFSEMPLCQRFIASQKDVGCGQTTNRFLWQFRDAHSANSSERCRCRKCIYQYLLISLARLLFVEAIRRLCGKSVDECECTLKGARILRDWKKKQTHSLGGPHRTRWWRWWLTHLLFDLLIGIASDRGDDP